MKIATKLVTKRLKGEEVTIKQIIGEVQRKNSKSDSLYTYHNFIIWAIESKYGHGGLFEARPKAVQELIDMHKQAARGLKINKRKFDAIRALARLIKDWFGYKNLYTISKKCGIDEREQKDKLLSLINEAMI